MKQMEGMKHLIQCHCILPHLRNKKETIFHSFVAFSILDDEGNVIPKDAICNNCGVVHRIVDLCKSEITSKEKSSSIISIDDIKLMIPSDLSNILTNYNCDIATWEQAYFIYSNKKWKSKIVIAKESDDSTIKGKILTIVNSKKFLIETFETNVDIKS